MNTRGNINMKIPHVNNSSISSAVTLTVKSSRQILRGTKKYVEQAGHKGKCAVLGAAMLSSALSTQFINNKQGTLFSKIEKDIFVKTKPMHVKEGALIGSKAYLALKKTTKKMPAVKSAKDVILSDMYSEYLPEDINLRFNNLLLKPKTKKNPLKNKAGVFIQKAEKYKVNPTLLMAISMTESARGRSDAALIKNNVGGINGRKGLRKFKNVDDCIEVMAETISNHHYKRKIDTLEELAYSGKYCDKKAAKEWMNHIMFYMKKLS